MDNKKWSTFIAFLCLISMLFSLLGVQQGWIPHLKFARAAGEFPEENGNTDINNSLMATTESDPLVMSYSAKFVCTAALPPGQVFYGTAAPIVQEETGVLIHNPNDFPVVFYKKAVQATTNNPPDPGGYTDVILDKDRALRIDCNEITRMLTGNPTATFVGTYGIGVTVEGFVVILVGPQLVPSRGDIPYAHLDVQAEYVRSSEVLKKDISYQPWWSWWWWPLPWRLGYPYQRVIIANELANIDCRGLLFDALLQDTFEIADPLQRDLTVTALTAGSQIDAATAKSLHNDDPPALVPIIGECKDYVGSDGKIRMSISYFLASNKGPSDVNPINGIAPIPIAVLYPWIPGRYYDLPAIMTQNMSTDMDGFFHEWHIQQWFQLPGPLDYPMIVEAMNYYLPYWGGWSRWWGWNNVDGVNIGVGGGESLDVEQISPIRVMMVNWPPVSP